MPRRHHPIVGQAVGLVLKTVVGEQVFWRQKTRLVLRSLQMSFFGVEVDVIRSDLPDVWPGDPGQVASSIAGTNVKLRPARKRHVASDSVVSLLDDSE